MVEIRIALVDTTSSRSSSFQGSSGRNGRRGSRSFLLAFCYFLGTLSSRPYEKAVSNERSSKLILNWGTYCCWQDRAKTRFYAARLFHLPALLLAYLLLRTVNLGLDGFEFPHDLDGFMKIYFKCYVTLSIQIVFRIISKQTEWKLRYLLIRCSLVATFT